MAKLTLNMSGEDFKSLLGEGFHTAFRKGTEHPSSGKIWNLISELPEDEWAAIIDWVADPFLTMWGEEEQ